LRLHELPLGRLAYIDHVEWELLSPSEGQRLRELGICEGACIEALHRGGLLGKGPVACRIGRVTVAMRRSHAAAILTRAEPELIQAAE
jgi:ferrous iron transport protein A